MTDFATEHPNAGVIGFILKGYPRLSETFILNEIFLLEQMGFNLHILAMRNPGESKVHERVGQIRARVTYIPDYFWRFFSAVMRANIRLWQKRPRVYRRALGYALRHSLRHRDSSTLKRFAQAAYLVENALPGSGIRYFHSHFSNDPTTVAFFASWLTGIPYSFSAHAKDIYLQPEDLLYRKVTAAQFVVTCTEYNKNYLDVKFGELNVPFFCCYHGVDPEMYAFREKAVVNGCPNILSVGRLVPKKGFPALIEALYLLRQKGYNFRCVIVGNGPLKESLQKQIADLQLGDRVQLAPEMSQKELVEYYREADVFALACEVQEDGDRDGIPNVIVEAMALGVPVVSTRISGIPECVEDGVTGILVPQKNPAALAEALASLFDQPARARKLARAARQKVEREFDSRKNVEEIAAALLHASEQASRKKPSRFTREAV